MSFTPIYYICIACPTVEKTLEMVDKYIAHGAKAFQIDMPSKNPFSETEFVKKMMAGAVNSDDNYDKYMNGIRAIRNKYPELELHIVVYNDVIDSIGLEKFCAFAKEVNAASLMIPGSSSENLLFLEINGFRVFRSITHEMSEIRIQLAEATNGKGIISLRNKKPGEITIPGFETFEKKYKYVTEVRNVTSPIYSVFGISSYEELANVKKTGARGAIIGNVLMKMWDDEDKMFELLDSFQSLAE